MARGRFFAKSDGAAYHGDSGDALPAIRFRRTVSNVYPAIFFGNVFTGMCIRQYSLAMCLRECVSSSILRQCTSGDVYPATYLQQCTSNDVYQATYLQHCTSDDVYQATNISRCVPVIWRYPFCDAISVYPATHFRQHTSESESKQKSKKQHMRRIEQIKPASHQNAPAKML